MRIAAIVLAILLMGLLVGPLIVYMAVRVYSGAKESNRLEKIRKPLSRPIEAIRKLQEKRKN